jgi:ABC-type transport system substrate-binding protein
LERKAVSSILLTTVLLTIMTFNVQSFRVISEVTAQGSSIPSFVTENKFVYEGGNQPQWLDPQVSYSYDYDNWILQQTLETLIWYNGSSSTQVVPWLAEEYTKISDTTYEFKLRQNIKFQDGTPFNATTVWFSLNRLLIMDGTSDTEVHGSQAAWILQQLLDPSLSSVFGGPQPYDPAWVKLVLEQNFVEIIDLYTIRINVMTPMQLQLPYLLSGPWASVISPTSVIPKEYAFHNWGTWDGNVTKYFVKAAGEGHTYYNVPKDGWKIGTGPYYLDSYDPTTYKVVLKVNPNYWGGPNNIEHPIGQPKIKELDFNYVENFATRLFDLKAGKATGIAVASPDLFAVVDRDEWLQNGIFKSIIPEVTAYGPFPQLRNYWFNFETNVTDAQGNLRTFQPMNDRRIRLAIASAVNLTDINVNVNNKLGQVANNLIPPGTAPAGSYGPAITPPWSYDLRNAAELLVDAMKHPMTSFTYVNGTPIPPGVIDNRFGDTNGDGKADISYTIEMYVGAADVLDQKILETIAANLNIMARNVDQGGNATGLYFAVVPVPGGQQYTLASRHQIYMYWGGWFADYNYVIDWLEPMFKLTGTYYLWNRLGYPELDEYVSNAEEADAMGDLTALLKYNELANKFANDKVLYFYTFYPLAYFVRSSFLKGWYFNTALSGENFASMYYEVPTPSTLVAGVDITPDTLNLKSKGKWIMAYIELPEGYDAADINVSTILLNGTVPGELSPAAIGDYDSDGIPDLMVKFDRNAVVHYIYDQGIRYGNVNLTITGKLNDGTLFEGSGVIKVIFPDLNNDRKVDLRDLAIVIKAYCTKPGDKRWNPAADVNKDNHVDISDLALVINNLGATAP